MSVRIDPSLGEAGSGPPPGRLGGAEPPVTRAGVAGAVPFLLEGERVAVVGRERAGEHTVWIDGVAVLANLATDAGAAVNVVAAPATLRREILGRGTTLIETTLAAPTLPLAAVQWAPAPGGRRPKGGLEVAFSVLPRARDLRYHAGEDALRAVADDDPDAFVEVRLHPAPSAWTVVEGADGGLGVRATVPEAEVVTLLVARERGEKARRAVAAAAHLASHEIRAAAEADPGNLETLATVSGVPDLDHGVVWASARVRRGLERGGDGTESTFWSALGTLAVGDADASQAAASALAGVEGDVPWALGGTVATAALSTLLAARTTLLAGDAGPALAAADWLSQDRVASLRRDAGPDMWPVWSLALTTLADALRYATDDDTIQALRTAAALPGGRGGMRLPMAGKARGSGTVADTLRSLLGGAGASPPGGPAPGATPLGSWALWAAGEPDAAWSAWRRLLAQGLSGAGRGRGCWDDVAAPPGLAPRAGLLLCALGYGLLGLAPDAPSGRIRLAPALPAHLTSFAARGIRVGEVRFTLRYTREGTLHRFTLEPTRGRVPAMIVLEPSLPGPRATVRVDGSEADVESVQEGARTRVRLQIPLDDTRTVEVHGSE